MTAADDVETALAEHIARALADVADEFNNALNGRGSLTAAAFRVSSIAAMWRRHVTPLVDRALAAYEQAARWTATGLGTDLPPGWDDLPGQAPASLPDPVAEYRAAVEDLLEGVGEQLGERARAVLAAGLDADESPNQIRDRLRVVFAADGPQLGPGRAERLARTEATRVWNAATLASAQTVAEPGQTLHKEWNARGDASVRTAHRAANGQRRPLDEPFTVGGVLMSGPGDPAAPAALTVNCRCTLRITASEHAAPFELQPLQRAHVYETQECPMRVTAPAVTAADRAHTGAMIALVPAAADAERLAVPGGEAADELHLTLYFLGEADQWTEVDRSTLTDRLTDWAAAVALPVQARAFGVNRWNTDTDTPVSVWAIGDDPDRDPDSPTLDTVHTAVTDTVHTLSDGPPLPEQHTPWQPHVTAAYTGDVTLLPELEGRLGPLTFDRLRVAFAGEYTDIPLTPEPEETPMEPATATAADAMPTRAWSTPDDTAIAFEDQQTGDGRLFAAGALHWDGAGPWPLQYADEMLMGHEGAELAGAIQEMGRDGDRITATGVLYLSRPAGADAAMLLEEGAPLGVSVDLDDVDIEVVDTNGDGDDGAVIAASIPSASILRLDDGGLLLTAQTTPTWTASGAAFTRGRQAVQIITGPGGRISATAVRDALAGTGTITAAAGDPDPGTGTVVHTERSGDLLMRITRGRVRGATLVSMPAYDKARIVLDDIEEQQEQDREDVALAAAGKPGPDHQRVVSYVSASPVPVGARAVAQAVGISMKSARGHLARAAEAGRIVRLAPGLYIGCTATLAEGTDLAAAMSGDTGLPIHPDRDYQWDGDAAASRVLDWATRGDAVDPALLGEAFLWRDADADPATLAAYKLGMADVFGDELHIVPRGVFAIASVLQGGRGGADIPEGEQDELRDRVTGLYERMADEFDDPSLVAPWQETPEADSTDEDDELAASAWSAMRDTDPMPADWFREPTAEELPPGSGGVHYKAGRIYGWVAQAGEPHAGFPNKNLTIESLGDIDTTHFLRARFALDDGTTVRAGAMTMNVGHHRDGAECETGACQFDDTRTVAGVVTVGMNARGMWFSGAAGPWLSEWDRTVFQACQPSYHMKQGPGRRWQLRAVLSVPVPGHSSPLIATAVAERSNLALAASAAHAVPLPEQATSTPTGTASELLAALTDAAFLDGLAAALHRRETERNAELRAEIDRMAADIAPSREEITASAARRGDR